MQSKETLVWEILKWWLVQIGRLAAAGIGHGGHFVTV